MGRRTLLLVAALLLAALGTSLVFVYVNNVDARAREGQAPVEVWVATKVITAGTTVAQANSDGSFATEVLPDSAALDDALGDLTPIADKVALSTIYPGEQLIEAKFGAEGEAPTVAIPPGKFAVAFEFADPNRVANFVAPGQQVAVMVTMQSEGAPVPAGQDFTQLLLPTVTVLAVGGEATGQVANQAGEEVPTRLLTLALDETESKRLIFAQGRGELYLALRGTDSPSSPTDPITGENLFPAAP
jgi:pilus assembly protein CpaB